MIIVQAYVEPFRKDLQPGQCIICGRYTRAREAKAAKGIEIRESSSQDKEDETDMELDLCKCPSATKCDGCKVYSRISAYFISFNDILCTLQKRWAYPISIRYASYDFNLGICFKPSFVVEKVSAGTVLGPDLVYHSILDIFRNNEEIQQRTVCF